MVGSKFPRYVLIGLALGVGIAVATLSMFYAHYRWLAADIVSASVTEHDLFLQNSFAARERAQMGRVSHQMALEIEAGNSDAVPEVLETFLHDSHSMLGMRFTANDSTSIQVGDIPQTGPVDGVLWLPDKFILDYPVEHAEQHLGELSAAFLLDDLLAESDGFRAHLAKAESQNRRASYLGIGFGSLAAMAVLLIVVWLIMRGHTARIRALKL
jgi:hypothetical protein